MQTKITSLLNIRYPIIQGGMVWVSGPRLVGAVSNAGGLGLLAGGSLLPDQLGNAIDAVRGLTDQPFGVNLPLIYPQVAEHIAVIKERRVPVVVTSAGHPRVYTHQLKASGIKVMHVVPNTQLAKKCEIEGVDAIIAEGYEAGGHNSPDEISTMALIPQVVDAVSIPVIAAGGIADARGMLAAIALGAEGIQMGTRFLASLESDVKENYLQAIIAAADNGTIISLRHYSPVRTLKNNLAKSIRAMEQQGLPTEDILAFIGKGRQKQASAGDLVNGLPQCGQIAGMIKNIISSEQIISQVINDINTVMGRLQGIVGKIGDA